MSEPPKRRRSLARNVFAIVVYGAIVVLVVRSVDFRTVSSAIGSLTLTHLAIIGGVSLSHIGLRATRYHVLLSAAHPKAYRWHDGVRIFLAGLSIAAVTPGRVGDFVKAGLVRKHGVAAGYGFGIVLVERVLDLLALLICLIGAGLALTGAAQAQSLRFVSLLALAGLIAGVVVVGRPTLRTAAMGWLSRALARSGKAALGARMEAVGSDLFEAWDRAFSTPWRFFAWLAFSLATWLVEFAKLYLVLAFLGLPHTWPVVLFVYPASILAGVLSVLPFSEGAVGLTGVSLLAALSAVSASSGTAAIVIDRAASTLPPVLMWLVFTLTGATRAFRDEVAGE